ncbi:MAG TPA: response regulator, partial [bacterium]|nr:response regulator [bacterium]
MATILLVEPNAPFRRMMEQELRKAGHEVFGADDARIAARALRERELDLVVIELVIPGEVTAADLLASMRDDPLPGDPARIAMAAEGNFARNEGFFRAEYLLDAFLLKPFLPSKLRATVDEALAARERRRSTPKISEWNSPGGFMPPPLEAPSAAKAPAVVVPPPPPPAAS